MNRLSTICGRARVANEPPQGPPPARWFSVLLVLCFLQNLNWGKTMTDTEATHLPDLQGNTILDDLQAVRDCVQSAINPEAGPIPPYCNITAILNVEPGITAVNFRINHNVAK